MCSYLKVVIRFHLLFQDFDFSSVVCQICDHKFDNEVGLAIHQNRAHPQSTVPVAQCPECKQIFQHRGILRKHIACTHRRQKRFKCTLCRYKSYYLSEMKTHFGRKHPNEEVLPKDQEFLIDQPEESQLISVS